MRARNDSVWYRTTKFVARHKAAVAASVLVVIALMTGLIVTLHEARVARIERARAERRFNDVRKLANSLMFEVHDSIRDLPGTLPARKLLVNRALEYLDSLSQEASGDTDLQRELAAAYDRVGDLLGIRVRPILGTTPVPCRATRRRYPYGKHPPSPIPPIARCNSIYSMTTSV